MRTSNDCIGCGYLDGDDFRCTVGDEDKCPEINMQAEMKSDLISREKAFDVLSEYYHHRLESQHFALKEALSRVPSAEPERKHGRWLPDNTCVYETRFICSSCNESMVIPTIGFTKYKPIWDFCPNCGADMRGEQDG